MGLSLFLFLLTSEALSYKSLYETRSSLDYTGLLGADFNGDRKDEIIGDFGSLGIWWYDITTSVWTQITTANPEWIIVGDFDGGIDEELCIDFGNSVYIYDPTSDTWVRISYNNPHFGLSVDETGDGDDEIIFDFDALGLWLYEPTGNVWTREGSANAASGFQGLVNYLDDSATDIYFDYDALGCWFRFGGWGAFHRDSYSNPGTIMAAASLDATFSGFQVICNFGVFGGLWAWGGMDAPRFQKITNNIPEAMTRVHFSGDVEDELVGDFGSQGLWFLDPTGGGILSGIWTKISWTDPGPMLAADLEGGDDELVVDFESLGIWVYSWNDEFFLTGWTQIAYNNPDVIIKFRPYPGVDWLIADFGSLGLWMYFNDTITGWQWKKISTNQIPEF